MTSWPIYLVILISVLAIAGIVWLNISYRRKIRLMNPDELESHEQDAKEKGVTY